MLVVTCPDRLVTIPAPPAPCARTAMLSRCLGERIIKGMAERGGREVAADLMRMALALLDEAQEADAAALVRRALLSLALGCRPSNTCLAKEARAPTGEG